MGCIVGKEKYQISSQGTETEYHCWQPLSTVLHSHLLSSKRHTQVLQQGAVIHVQCNAIFNATFSVRYSGKLFPSHLSKLPSLRDPSESAKGVSLGWSCQERVRAATGGNRKEQNNAIQPTNRETEGKPYPRWGNGIVRGKGITFLAAQHFFQWPRCIPKKSCMHPVEGRTASASQWRMIRAHDCWGRGNIDKGVNKQKWEEQGTQNLAHAATAHALPGSK